MKRFLAYILIFLILCFSIQIIFTSKAKPTISNNTENKEEQQTVADYDYKQYNTVKLLHTSTNKVEKLGLDEYLYGVVSSEMPASFEKEALKAQACHALKALQKILPQFLLSQSSTYYKENISCIVLNSSLIYGTIQNNTITSPARLSRKVISSLPLCFKTCPSTVITIPSAAILKIIEISIIKSFHRIQQYV